MKRCIIPTYFKKIASVNGKRSGPRHHLTNFVTVLSRPLLIALDRPPCPLPPQTTHKMDGGLSLLPVSRVGADRLVMMMMMMMMCQRDGGVGIPTPAFSCNLCQP